METFYFSFFITFFPPVSHQLKGHYINCMSSLLINNITTVQTEFLIQTEILIQTEFNSLNINLQIA